MTCPVISGHVPITQHILLFSNILPSPGLHKPGLTNNAQNGRKEKEGSRPRELGTSISAVDDTRNMVKFDQTTLSPFLNGEVLNVDVTRTSGRLVLVDHGDGGHVVDVDRRRRRRNRKGSTAVARMTRRQIKKLCACLCVLGCIRLCSTFMSIHAKVMPPLSLFCVFYQLCII